MHMEAFPEFFGNHVGDGTRIDPSTGIADQTVQSPEMIGRRFHHRCDFTLFRHIYRHETRVLTEFRF